jgi:hypothetical protein
MSAVVAALPDHRHRMAPNYLYAFDSGEGIPDAHLTPRV